MTPTSQCPEGTKDQIARETIPTRESIPTLYHPCGNWLMVVSLPEADKIGDIIIPDKHKILMNEGHIIECGPEVPPEKFLPGDCITWDVNSEYRFTIDNVNFILVRDVNVIMRIGFMELNRSAEQRRRGTPEGLSISPDWRAGVDNCVCPEQK